MRCLAKAAGYVRESALPVPLSCSRAWPDTGLSLIQGLDCIVSDGPPGIGCPAVASLTGADLALLVTEPTLSGIHDLERVLGLCRYFDIPAMVCINKCDLNGDNSRRIEGYCRDQGIEVAARVPFDNVVTEALVRGLPVVEYSSNKVTQEIENLWQRTRAKLGTK